MDAKGEQLTRSNDNRDMSTMASKCQSLRFLFINEAEALGAGIIGRVELNASTATRPQWYKYSLNRRTDLPALRVFEGINLMLLGDFWQLAPVGRLPSVCRC